MDAARSVQRNDEELTERARGIILRYGLQTPCYQLLNPGLRLWIHRLTSGSSVNDIAVGYVRTRGAIVAAPPVCAAGLMTDVCAAFEKWARRCVIYVLADSATRELLEHAGPHRGVCIGAQPTWNPQDWPGRVKTHRSIRSQIRRAGKKGVTILTGDDLPDDAQLYAVLRAWLATRSAPPLRFLTEPDTLAGVRTDRLIFSAIRGGQCIAYLLASPVPAAMAG